MSHAAGVPGGFAAWAGVVGREVVRKSEFGAADAAEGDDFGVVGVGVPQFGGVGGEGVVAGATGEELAAALEAHGDDVEGGVPVNAARLWVEVDAEDFGADEVVHAIAR